MEKTFLVYCRHVSFVTKGGVWCYSLRLRRREEFWGSTTETKDPQAVNPFVSVGFQCSTIVWFVWRRATFPSHQTSVALTGCV